MTAVLSICPPQLHSPFFVLSLFHILLAIDRIDIDLFPFVALSSKMSQMSEEIKTFHISLTSDPKKSKFMANISSISSKFSDPTPRQVG
jgi:hypothetical protein